MKFSFNISKPISTNFKTAIHKSSQAVMMNILWEKTLQSNDVIKYNAHNTYIEISLKSSKRVTNGGQTEVKIDCWTKSFQNINNQKIYKAEEEYTSNIYIIKEGRITLTNRKQQVLGQCPNRSV